MIYLAIGSGMRPQEYVAIAGSSIQRDGIQVQRAVDANGDLSVVKTPASRRFIELSSETVELVTHYRDKIAVKNDYDLVFPTKDGVWQLPCNWGEWGFKAVCEQAGLGRVMELSEGGKFIPKCTPYAIRHYFASKLIADNTDIAKVAGLMGHSDINTTLTVYTHLIHEAENRRKRRTRMISSIKGC